MKPFELIDPSRFYAAVQQGGRENALGPCDLWLGVKGQSGTGQLTAKDADGRTVNFKAHRVAHWLAYSRMPDELFCIHACGSVDCVNPRHLYLSDRKKGIGPARILRAVDMSAGQGPSGECWCYSGYREPKSGYGVFVNDRRKTVAAHRYAFTVFCEPIPEQAMVLHRCDHGPCCNPAHLYLGDHTRNMLDRQERGRTARNRGHFKLTEDQAIQIKADPRKFEDIASDFSVSRTTVSLIKRGKRWVNLPSSQ